MNPILPTPVPTIGRIVHYQTDGRGGYRYTLPAMVVRTLASSDRRAIADGKVAALPDVYTVDLLVFSCGGESYGENGVPYADAEGASLEPGSEYGPPRTWRWPPRTGGAS